MAGSLRHLIRAVVWLVALWVTWTAHAAARGNDAAQTTDNTTRTRVEFSVFARHRVKGLQVLPADGAEPIDVEFFGKARSPRYTADGDGTVVFYDAKELAAYRERLADGAQDRPALPPARAIAQVPAGVERALLLFIPVRGAAAGGVRFHVFVVDDGPRRVPAGHASVINASGREYMAQLGGRVLELPHGVSETVPIAGEVELRLAARTDEGWEACGVHTFEIGERERVNLVLFPPTSRTGIAPVVRTLIDEPPDATTEASQADDARTDAVGLGR